MARRTDGPIPPRDGSPDLPRRLEETSELQTRTEVFAARITGLTGHIDASHAHLTECVVEGATIDRWDLTGAALTDVRIDDLRATEVVARDTRWRSVEISGGRIGTLDLMRAEFDGIIVRGARIDYLSLPAAQLADVQFIDCRIGTMDLPQATTTRVAFTGSQVDEVDTRGLRAQHTDLRGLEALSFTDPTALRGATLSPQQAETHAVALAVALGISVAG